MSTPILLQTKSHKWASQPPSHISTAVESSCIAASCNMTTMYTLGIYLQKSDEEAFWRGDNRDAPINSRTTNLCFFSSHFPRILNFLDDSTSTSPSCFFTPDIIKFFFILRSFFHFTFSFVTDIFIFNILKLIKPLFDRFWLNTYLGSHLIYTLSSLRNFEHTFVLLPK